MFGSRLSFWEFQYIYIYLNFQNSKKTKRSNKSEYIFFEFSEFKKLKNTSKWKPQKWEADLPIVIYVSKKNQSQIMYSKNLNTKLCIQKIQNYVLKNAKLCVCGSLSENFIPGLKAPKIINTKLYFHPKKPPILDYVAK